MSEQNGSGPRINVSSITLDELCEIEEKVGRRVSREIATFDFGADTLRAMVWIALRRDNPAATLADAGRLSFDQLMEAVEEPDTVPPPTPASGPTGSSATSPAGSASPNSPPSVALAPSSASSTP